MLAAIKLHPDKEYLEEIRDQAEDLFKINLWELLFNEDFPDIPIDFDTD